MSIAAIAIGRNEGDRLKSCLASLKPASPIIYVDSGSTDGSVELARATGAEVLDLDISIPFTAARARNEGFKRLRDIDPKGEFVQFIDGDCELRDGWLETAIEVMKSDIRVAVVCGRRRERYPNATRWNRLIDAEWDTPLGETKACGGDALIRRAALMEVGGYSEDMIAGEEPEMCFRMRENGWKILRIDSEMTWHDAAITDIAQWWLRNVRAGYAYAESATRHGQGTERFRVTETRRALFWGLVVPLVALLSTSLSAWGVLTLLAWPLQTVRLVFKGMTIDRAWFLTFGKMAEAQGVVSFHWNRFRGRRRSIIEYK